MFLSSLNRGICDLINYYLEFRLVYISTMGWMDIVKENTDIMEGYQVSCLLAKIKVAKNKVSHEVRLHLFNLWPLISSDVHDKFVLSVESQCFSM